MGARYSAGLPEPADRDPVAGIVYVLSLALFAAAPWLLARRINRR